VGEEGDKRRAHVRLRHGLGVLLVLAAVQLVAAASAEGFVYWTNDGVNSIGRANLDGTSANQGFITGASRPVGVAVNGSSLFWSNNAANSFGIANLDGSGARIFIGPGQSSSPEGIALDASHIYWANLGGPSIGRANIDGTGANALFIAAPNSAHGVAVDASHIYWATGLANTIGRANLDGTGATQSFITGAGDPFDVAVDAAHIYWANRAGNTIGRANLDGTGANQTFIAGASLPEGVAMDSGHIYWTNLATNTIGRANLDGTGANQTFISRASIPRHLAVDALGPAPPPAPVLARTMTLSRVNGTVRVRLRGSRRFVDLVQPRTIPVGSTVDTTAGRVKLTTAPRGGSQQSADFYAGVFVSTQTRNGLTTLALPAAEGCGRSSSARVARRRTHRLWGNGQGRFRTRGRYAAATVRGTVWLTVNRCDGTSVQVTQGVVQVRDFPKRRTMTIRAGHRYLARAPLR